MTITTTNGNAGDHAVGLAAVSSWQGWLRHEPRRSEFQQPGYGASNFGRFFSTFSWNSPKSAFGYFKNGHTALLVRIRGEVTHIVGFNPDSYLLAGILQTIQGNDITVKGLWYDDMAMARDPTAISYEVNVSLTEAQAFDTLVASLVGRSDLGPHSPPGSYYYSFRPADVEPSVDGIVGNSPDGAAYPATGKDAIVGAAESGEATG
jgi:hypothetical protein